MNNSLSTVKNGQEESEAHSFDFSNNDETERNPLHKNNQKKVSNINDDDDLANSKKLSFKRQQSSVVIDSNQLNL